MPGRERQELATDRDGAEEDRTALAAGARGGPLAAASPEREANTCLRPSQPEGCATEAGASELPGPRLPTWKSFRAGDRQEKDRPQEEGISLRATV